MPRCLGEALVLVHTYTSLSFMLSSPAVSVAPSFSRISVATSNGRQTPEPTQEVERVLQHERYYIPSGDVIFLVENHLFRVHRYFLVRESVIFRDMLSMPPPVGTEPEGSSDMRPIILPQIKSVDFARFLWIFYNQKYGIYTANLEEWTSILSLAHRWQFDEVKNLAMNNMEKLYIDPVEKVVLARSYDVERDWLLEAYTALGKRDKPLTDEEGTRLRLKTVIKLAQAREQIRSTNITSELLRTRTATRSPSPNPNYYHSPQMVSPQLHILEIPEPRDAPQPSEDASTRIIRNIFGL